MNVRYFVRKYHPVKLDKNTPFGIGCQKNPRNLHRSVREAMDQRTLTMKNYFLETQRDSLRSVFFHFWKKKLVKLPFGKVPSKL
jgi:hypothetical protein